MIYIDIKNERIATQPRLKGPGRDDAVKIQKLVLNQPLYYKCNQVCLIIIFGILKSIIPFLISRLFRRIISFVL